VNFAVNMPKSWGTLGVATTNIFNIRLQKDGADWGNMTFQPGASVANFVALSGASFEEAKVLLVLTEGFPDSTAADLGFSLAGTRGI
jgi:hypothetical protein